jgi:hypothetical protein
MQRLLSAVVLVSVGAFAPAHALAQTAVAPPPVAPKAAASSAPASAPSAVKPAAAAPASSAVKPAVPAPASSAVKPSLSRPAVAKPAVNESSSKAADRLSDEAELSRVVGFYEAGKYRECSSELERLLDPTGRLPLRQPAIVENARVYWAACLLGAGEGDAADAPLRAAIHENPQMKPPDSLVFPQPVVEHFLKVRDSLVTEIRAAEQTRIKQAQEEARARQQTAERERQRMRELELLARQESIVYKNSRVLAAVPFGVGQLQNRQETLGYTLMVGELVAGGLCLGAIAWQNHMATQADDQRRLGNKVDEQGLEDNQALWGTVKRVSFWTFAAAAAGGVLQAQLEFMPEFRETRLRRNLPDQAPRSKPAQKNEVEVSAVPYVDGRGGGLSFFGRF